MSQGRPRPRNTFTEFEPVTFPMALSAFLDYLAAWTEANVSGREVPRATKVMAVIAEGNPMVQPKRFANSPTMAVMMPMKSKATPKVTHPLPMRAGGMQAKTTFHPIVRKWKKASEPFTGWIIPSSSTPGCSLQASVNCCAQVFSFSSKN